MILRKPYAFFIKHFRLIHLILASLIVYSLYRTKIVLDFFNEYAATTMSVVGQDLTGTYLYGIIYLIPIFIIAVTILIMVIMIVKKKPSLFYFINILIYIYYLIILFVADSTLTSLQVTLLEVRTTRFVRDLITISFISQIISATIVFIRATGFDIKKFDFRKDLQELEIEEADSEEFELEFKFDKNKLIRSLRRTMRQLKYFYKENRLLANIFIIMIACTIGFFTYNSYKSRQQILNQGSYFSGNNFNLSVTDSYLTNTDYKGNIIDDDYYYLILRIKIKGNNDALDMATTKVVIDKFVYTPNLEKRELLFDFGNIYNDETIGADYEIKSLIYEIPKQLIGKDIIFSYVKKNTVGKSVKYTDAKVSIKYDDLTQKKENITYNLNDLVELNSSFNNYKFIINEASFDNYFKLDYNFCISDKCYPSYEYIKPSLTSNYDKIILKLKGSLTIGDVNMANVNDLYDFIKNFGKIKYELNGNEYIQNIDLKEVLSKKVAANDIYYIEVLKEVLNASKVSITFTFRNQTIEYILK